MSWLPGPLVHQKLSREQPESWQVGAGATVVPKLTLESRSTFRVALGRCLSSCAVWGEEKQESG